MMKLRTKKKVIIIVLIALIFFVLNLHRPLQIIRNSFYVISLPTQRTFWRLSQNVSNFFEASFGANSLSQRNRYLASENEQLLAKLSLLRETEKENKSLRKALNLNLASSFNLKLVEVTAKEEQDYFLINCGKNCDLKKGFPVITEEKVLVGKIVEVDENFSKVMLISHPDSSIDIEIQQRNILALAKGEGNFKVSLNFISPTKNIEENDLIVTSRLGGTFPPGLLVGRVKNVRKEATASFQKADISPLFDIKDINYLFVLKSF